HDYGPHPVLVFGHDSTRLYGYSTFAKILYKDEQKSELLPTKRYKAVVEWDARTGKEQRLLELETSFGTKDTSSGTPFSIKARVALSPDGKTLAVAGLNNTLEFIDVAAFKWVDIGSEWTFSLSAIQFTPDGKHLFSVDKGKILKWDIGTTKRLMSDAPPLVSE